MSAAAGWILITVALVVIIVLAYDLARRVDDYEARLDWTPPQFQSPLDREALFDLPYSATVSDEELLRVLAEIRALPETPEVVA